jgi:cathepsin A (carboxypeptidase C)
MKVTPVFLLVAFSVFSLYSSSLAVSNDFAHPDLIVRPIPGLNTPLKSKHYSGFLDAGKGKKFHYWFVESEGDPINDPVVLWLNGGPGCSSLLGFLTEQGPFWLNKNNSKLIENEFRWNKIANMIFLESPAGVGYSHRTDDGSLDTNDDAVADDNHAAITHFFKKFPQFKKNRFYVTGESYAGIYVPTLSVRLLTKSPDINFKGFAVGNGILDWKMNTNSLILFGYFHGMIGKKLWDPLVRSCCSQSKKDGQMIPGGCDFDTSKNLSCKIAVKNAYEAIASKRINRYNL